MPKIGDSVKVLHTSNGKGRLSREKNHSIAHVCTVYHNGHIATESGDVWTVRRCKTGGAKWETAR